MIYTLSGVVAKLAASYSFLSINFVLLYGLEIFILGVYAILWQQVIKHVTLVTSYANRSVAILWALFFSVLLFGETVTTQNIIGAIIVLIGVFVVNSDE